MLLKDMIQIIKINTNKNEPYSSRTIPHSSRTIKNSEIILNKNYIDSTTSSNTKSIYIKKGNINEPLKENKIIINKDIKNKNSVEKVNTNDKINKNYIIGEIDIIDYSNEDIRIINSFEEFVKENKDIKKENKDIFKNENEIKDNCIIEINNKIIPFSYYYKFENKGKYQIKYSFKKNMTN